MLPVPILFSKALGPIAKLELPRQLKRALYPSATLLDPTTFELRALTPMAVFWVPVRLVFNALSPNDVLVPILP
jgi:hypothetical protein